MEYRFSEPGKETLIKVKVLSPHCFSGEPIPALNKKPITYHNVPFYAPADVADGKLGLYSGLENAAEENCMHGSVDREGDVKLTSDGCAVLVFDAAECSSDWFTGLFD